MNDAQRLERLYGAAGRELRRILLGLEPAGYTDAKAAAVRGRARDIVRMLNAGAQAWIETAIPRAYSKGAMEARTALEILGRKPRRGPITVSIVRIASDLMATLARANNSIPAFVDRYLAAVTMASRAVAGAMLQEFEYAQVAGDVDRLAAEAVAQQQSRGRLQAQVRDLLRDMVEDDQFIQIGNRMYRMNKYAELVARTTLREAQTAATLDLCREYENDLVIISDHGCDCDLCEQYEGNTYSVSGQSMRYPMLPDSPPFHPNCKHSMLPTSEEAEDIRKEYGESTMRRTIKEAEEAALWRNVR